MEESATRDRERPEMASCPTWTRGTRAPRVISGFLKTSSETGTSVHRE